MSGIPLKHIVSPYGGVGWSIALHELCRKASEIPDYRVEHEDHRALYLFLDHLNHAITLIRDAQNTGQLFCAGVHADYFVAIKVEIDGLWPYVTTLLDWFADCSRLVGSLIRGSGFCGHQGSGLEPAAIAVYKWLVKPSRFRVLLQLLARGHIAFYVATHNDKMMRHGISMFNITEGEFVETIVDAVLGERLSKLRKIDYTLGAYPSRLQV